MAIPLLFVLIVAAVAGGMAYLQYQARQRRAAAVAALGQRLTFTFSPTDVEGLERIAFSFFELGERQRLTNVLSGTHNGVPTHFFDYAYYVSNGKSGEWHRFTCAIATVPATCPQFALGHENFFTRTAEHLGMHDVQLPVQQALGQGIGQLMAVAEAYPDLEASTEFLTLEHELVDTEDRIQVSRRIYNANVRAYDTLVQTFPAMLVANLFGFRPEPYFELDPAVRAAAPPSVDLSGQG